MTSLILRTQGYDIRVDAVPEHRSFVDGQLELIRVHGALPDNTVDYCIHDIERSIIDALPEPERFEHAERQMLRWTTEVIKLRPGQEPKPYVDPRTVRVDELRAAVLAWREMTFPKPTWNKEMRRLLDAIDGVVDEP